jgi:hypothetical protein
VLLLSTFKSRTCVRQRILSIVYKNAKQVMRIYRVGFQVLTAVSMKIAVFWVVAPCSLVEVGFEVLTAVSMKIAVFWVVAPCSLVEVYQRFRGPCCCLHHQGDRPDDGGSKDL